MLDSKSLKHAIAHDFTRACGQKICTVGSHLSQTPLKSDAGARFLRADFHLSQTHPLKSDTLGGSEKN